MDVLFAAGVLARARVNAPGDDAEELGPDDESRC